jgi:hypothetical protein
LGVTGDYDMHELAGDDPPLVAEDEMWVPQDPEPSDNNMYWYIHIWFFVTGGVMTILMMNILVGILGANYERYEEQSQVLFVRERARIISTLSARPYANWIWKKEELRKGFLYFTKKQTPNTEDERSTRRVMQIMTEDALRKQRAFLEANFAELQAKFSKLSEQVWKQISTDEAKFEKLEANLSEQVRKQTESLEAKFDQLLRALKPKQPAEPAEPDAPAPPTALP